MTYDMVPFCGEIINGVHRLLARVYYADTDFSGVVYHGRYLDFFERGRSELLRISGIYHSDLAEGVNTEKLAWIVRQMKINYKKPAKIDDVLLIETHIAAIGGARITIDQKISCDDNVLVTAKVDAAVINEKGLPRRFPKDFKENLFASIKS